MSSLAALSNVQQLLWLEAILKAAGGAVLVVAPISAIRLFGLPRPASPFWPRLLGALLLGMAAASVLEVASGARSGLGLAGSIAINLAAIAIIGALLILRRAAPSRRGRIILWLLVGLLSALSMVELAFAG